MRRLTSLCFLLFTIHFLSAQVYTSVAVGNWSDATTWDAAGVPPDPVPTGATVNLNHDVTVLSTVENLGLINITSQESSLIVGGQVDNRGQIIVGPYEATDLNFAVSVSGTMNNYNRIIVNSDPDGPSGSVRYRGSLNNMPGAILESFDVIQLSGMVMNAEGATIRLAKGNNFSFLQGSVTGGTFENEGLIEIEAGSFFVRNGNTLNNSPTGVINNSGRFSVGFFGGILNNSGVINNVLETSTLTAEAFSGNGIINSLDGTINNNGVVTEGGDSELNFSATTLSGPGGIYGGQRWSFNIQSNGTTTGTSTFNCPLLSPGKVLIKINGTNTDEFSVIEVLGEIDVSATELEVYKPSGYALAGGEEFEIITATNGVTGEFSSLNLTNIGPTFEWEVVYETNRVLLQVKAAAADEDGDGVSDDTDNCVSIANADQTDTDDDGMGDVCDDDDDGDGCLDVDDAEPLVVNTLEIICPGPEDLNCGDMLPAPLTSLEGSNGCSMERLPEFPFGTRISDQYAARGIEFSPAPALFSSNAFFVACSEPARLSMSTFSVMNVISTQDTWSSFSVCFAAYFFPPTMEAFDSEGNSLGTVTGLLAGSTSNPPAPEEFLSISFPGIASVKITSNGGGANLLMDNFSFTSEATGETELITFDIGESLTFDVINVEDTPIPTSFAATDDRTVTRTYTVEDTAGNEKTCTQIFTYAVDDAAPSLTCPEDETITLDSDDCRSTLTIDLTAPGISDNCGFTYLYDINSTILSPGSSFEFLLGTTEVTVNAQDASGNESSCSFDVTLTGPNQVGITCPPDIDVDTDLGACETTDIDLGTASIMALCDTDLSIQHFTPAEYSVGQTVIVWSAIDDAGNVVSSCQQTITVSEDVPPVAICTDVNLLDFLLYDNQDNVWAVDDGSFDNCGIHDIYLEQISDICYSLVVVDESGNMSTCQASLLVVDLENPEVDLVQPDCGQANGSISITPENESFEWEYSIDDGLSWSSGTFMSLAEGTYNVLAQVIHEGDCEESFYLVPIELSCLASVYDCGTSMHISSSDIENGQVPNMVTMSQGISTDALLGQSDDFTFMAGERVEMMSGFEVEQGAIFLAVIAPCD